MLFISILMKLSNFQNLAQLWNFYVLGQFLWTPEECVKSKFGRNSVFFMNSKFLIFFKSHTQAIVGISSYLCCAYHFTQAVGIYSLTSVSNGKIESFVRQNTLSSLSMLAEKSNSLPSGKQPTHWNRKPPQRAFLIIIWIWSSISMEQKVVTWDN